MAIELARIQLNRVHKIATLEQAALVYHRVPGLEGNVVQELGRDSVRLQLEGIFYGSKAKDDLEALRKVYKQRQPVDFLAEIVGQAYFSQVTLERFEVRQLADYPEQFSYCLTIAEYVAPPKSAAADTAAVDAAIKRDAQNFMNAAMLPDSLTPGSIPNLTNPVAPLKGALSPVGEATKNLGTATGGLTSLFEQELSEPTDKLPENVGKVPETRLDWRKASGAETGSGTPSSGTSSGTKPDAGTPTPTLSTKGWLAVQLLFRGIKMAGLPVQFYRLKENNQKGEAIGTVQVTDSEGIAKLQQPIEWGIYGCEIENQPFAIVTPVEENNPYILVLPIGQPEIEIYSYIDEDEDDDLEKAGVLEENNP